MLDNVELIIYMKFQKLLMTGCRDMNKKHQKSPKIFFKNRVLSLLHPYGALTSCKTYKLLSHVRWTERETDQWKRLIPKGSSARVAVRNNEKKLMRDYGVI